MNPTHNEMVIGFTGLGLEKLKHWAEGVAGQWDGDNPGLAEDRSHCASEIVEKVKELEVLLEEMTEYLWQPGHSVSKVVIHTR